MRKILLVTVLMIIAGAVWLQKPRPTQATMDIDRPRLAEQPAALPMPETKPDPVKAPPSRSETVQEKLHTLESQIEGLEHDLQQQGFPQVFQDERLSEQDRQHILEQMARLNQLQMEKLQWKNRLADLDAEKRQ